MNGLNTQKIYITKKITKLITRANYLHLIDIDSQSLLWFHKRMLYIRRSEWLNSTHLAIHWESTLSQKSSEVSCPGYNCRWCLLWRCCRGAQWMPSIVWHNQSSPMNGNLMIDPWCIFFFLHDIYDDFGTGSRLSQAWIGNCIAQNIVGCNYFSLPEITAFGDTVLIYAKKMGITELLSLWNCRLGVSYKKNELNRHRF